MNLLELLEVTVGKTLIIGERETKKEIYCSSAGVSKMSDQGAQGAV